MAQQQQPMNQTQAILSKYGITAPSKISNIQNVKQENINDIKIVQPNIPVSQPEVKVDPTQIAIQKYKNWLQASYQQQKASREAELAGLKRSDTTLSSLKDKLANKLDDISLKVQENFSQQSIEKAISGSANPIVIGLMGMTLLPKLIGPFVKVLGGIEAGIWSFFGLGTRKADNPGKIKQTGGWTFVKALKSFFGTEDENGTVSFGESLRRLIVSEGTKMFDVIKNIFRERVELIENIETPSTWSPIKGLIYIGEVLGTALGGEAFASWNERRKLGKELAKDIFTEDLKEGSRRKSISKSDISKGKIKIPERSVKAFFSSDKGFDDQGKPMAASLVVSDRVAMYLDDPQGKLNTGKIGYLFDTLKDLADDTKNKMIPVTDGFMSLFSQKDLTELQESGDIVVDNTTDWDYKWIANPQDDGKDTSKYSGYYDLVPRIQDKEQRKKEGRIFASVSFVSPKAINRIVGADNEDNLLEANLDKLSDYVNKKFTEKTGQSTKNMSIDLDSNERYNNYKKIVTKAQRERQALDDLDTEANRFNKNVSDLAGQLVDGVANFFSSDDESSSSASPTKLKGEKKGDGLQLKGIYYAKQGGRDELFNNPMNVVPVKGYNYDGQTGTDREYQAKKGNKMTFAAFKDPYYSIKAAMNDIHQVFSWPESKLSASALKGIENGKYWPPNYDLPEPKSGRNLYMILSRYVPAYPANMQNGLKGPLTRAERIIAKDPSAFPQGRDTIVDCKTNKKQFKAIVSETLKAEQGAIADDNYLDKCWEAIYNNGTPPLQEAAEEKPTEPNKDTQTDQKTEAPKAQPENITPDKKEEEIKIPEVKEEKKNEETKSKTSTTSPKAITSFKSFQKQPTVSMAPYNISVQNTTADQYKKLTDEIDMSKLTQEQKMRRQILQKSLANIQVSVSNSNQHKILTLNRMGQQSTFTSTSTNK